MRRPGPAVTLSSFVGRDDAKAELLCHLELAPLVSVLGPGGAGKTRLATEVAAALGQGGTRVVFVDLSVVTHPHAVLSAVAAAMGMADHPRPLLAEAVVDQLEDDKAVVVLDNCEHVRTACAEVAQALLEEDEELRVLATSRERLGVPGEVVWRIPPLSLPERPVLPQAFVESEAVQLFCDRAAALQPGFLPTAANVEAIVEICRRLDGNALAIELAAARIVALPPEEIAARLEQRFALLHAGPTIAPDRHRSLAATLEWSYGLLWEPERALLRRLSVFPASFGADAAEDICAGDGLERSQVLGLLTGLVDKSLVVAEPTQDTARFRLLHTVRAFAGERLAEVGRTDVLARRHATWCLALVEHRPPPSAGASSQGQWLERLEAEADNLNAALEWALAQGQVEWALRLVSGQMRLWECRGCFATARQCLEWVLDDTKEAPAALRAAVMHDAGVAALMTGDPVGAQAHLRASLELLDDEPDPTAAAKTRSLLVFLSTFGDDPAGMAELEQLAAGLEETGDDSILADAALACGQARLFRGQPHAARAHYEVALQAARRSGADALVAPALLGLGSAEVVQGHYAAAEEHLRQSAALAAAGGDAHTEVVSQCWSATLAHLRGDHHGARSALEQCLARTRAMGGAFPLAVCLLGLGEVTFDEGEAEAAFPLLDEAVAVASGGALAHLAAQGLARGAQAALTLGDVAGARARLDEALALARRRADKVAEGLALEGWAQLSRAEGDLTSAATRFRQALALHAEVGDPAAIARCLEAVGGLAAAHAEPKMGARLLGAAQSLRVRRDCARPTSHDEEHARLIESVRRALGDSFPAQWRHGEALSADAAVACAQTWRGLTRPRPAVGWEALTGAERRVAELVSHGQTNAQIAHRLQIAPATVKAHLRRVFAKLGVQTRTALAAELHQRWEW